VSISSRGMTALLCRGQRASLQAGFDAIKFARNHLTRRTFKPRKALPALLCAAHGDTAAAPEASAPGPLLFDLRQLAGETARRSCAVASVGRWENTLAFLSEIFSATEEGVASAPCKQHRRVYTGQRRPGRARGPPFRHVLHQKGPAPRHLRSPLSPTRTHASVGSL
jgi:hypothetical protein